MTTETLTTTAPRIYVACLAAYNNGILHGAWIDANREPWALWAEVSDMLARSPISGAEEYAIHDYEGFEGARIEEYSSLDHVAALAAFISEHGRLGGELLSYHGGDLEEARATIEDRYLGRYDSLADYARELTEQSVSIPEALQYYVDWQAMARDLELSGDVIAFELGCEEVHLFAT